MKKVTGYIYNGRLWTMKGEPTQWEMESAAWADAPAAQAFLKKNELTSWNVTVLSADGKWLIGKARTNPSVEPSRGLSAAPRELLFEGYVYDTPPPGFGPRRIDDERWTRPVRVGKRVIKVRS